MKMVEGIQVLERGAVGRDEDGGGYTGSGKGDSGP